MRLSVRAQYLGGPQDCAWLLGAPWFSAANTSKDTDKRILRPFSGPCREVYVRPRFRRAWALGFSLRFYVLVEDRGRTLVSMAAFRSPFGAGCDVQCAAPGLSPGSCSSLSGEP